VNSTTAVKVCSPVWSDYVWLARQEQSRLYPAVQKFIRAVELAGASVTGELVRRVRRRGGLRLVKFRLKRLVYSICLQPDRSEKYAGRVAVEVRNIRDAAMVACVGLMQHGELTRIMHRCGSDKANGRHNYTLFYDILFRDDRSRFKRIFEMGIGKGSDGMPGASLRGWKEYFDRASIFGGDIEEKVLFEENRIKTALVDQTNSESVERLFGSFGDEFDLIVDDGLHGMNANMTFFQCAFKRLKRGGLFIIEDVSSRARDRYERFLNGYDAAILDIPHRVNFGDNCIAVVARN
jgi:hypothetical protein